MLRRTPWQLIALGASLGAACVGPEPPDADAPPVIGRLKTRQGTSDLTLSSFGDGPNAIPTNARAGIIADVAPDMQRDTDHDSDDADGTRPPTR